VSLADRLRRRFARPPEFVRAVVLASPDEDERVLAWGELVRGEGWLVATSRGLRRVPAGLALDAAGEVGVLPWHEIGSARWSATADGGGSFAVVALAEVEPGVQARQPAVRHALAEAGELPAVVRKRVDQTVLDSRRAPLPGGGAVLLVARRVPGQAEREWTVVFDDDADRTDPAAREVARRKLADVVAADRPD
jgi:hypothetical protein